MKQRLLLGLALMTVMLITSCEKEQTAPQSILETTWTGTVTTLDNTTASTVLKFYETTYTVIITYIKGEESIVKDETGAYTYASPTVTMVPDNYNQTDFVTAVIHREMMYIHESSYVFEMQP